MNIRRRGFTLVELMIVLVIVAILAAVVYPSYTKYVRKSHRSAAQAQLMDIANRQQQFLLANKAFATKAALESSGYALPNSVAERYSYDVTLGAGTVPSFSVTFTPIGVQASDEYGTLTITSEGGRSSSSGNSW